MEITVCGIGCSFRYTRYLSRQVSSKKNAGKVHCLILLLVIEAAASFRQFQKFGDKYNHGGSKNNPDHSTYLIPKLKDNHSISREMPAQIAA